MGGCAAHGGADVRWVLVPSVMGARCRCLGLCAAIITFGDGAGVGGRVGRRVSGYADDDGRCADGVLVPTCGVISDG